MEFLKNHYEKLILGLMLLLMAVGAVMLILEVGTVQEELDKYKKMIVGHDGKAPPTVDLTNLDKVLKQVRNPPQVDFTKVHRLFNPDTWYVGTNGDLIAGTNVGVNAMVVLSITPLPLIIELASVTTNERPSVRVNMTRMFMKVPAEQNRKSVSMALNVTNTANTIDAVRKLVLVPREIGGTPEAPTVNFELLEPGKDPLKFTVSKAQGFTHVMDYSAHILYTRETNNVWRAARVGQPLLFAGDTNNVVEITATNVLIKAISNDKPTLLPLGPAQRPPPGKQP